MYMYIKQWGLGTGRRRMAGFRSSKQALPPNPNIVVEEDGISVQLSSLETSILLLCFSYAFHLNTIARQVFLNASYLLPAKALRS